MKKISTLLLLIFFYHVSFSQWVNLDSIPVVRCAFASFSIGDTGYAIAGGGSGGYLTDCEMYVRSTNTWSQIQGFPQINGNSPVGFAIGDTGYAGTGAWEDYEFSNSFWKYNVHTNAWIPIAGIPTAGRAGAVSFVINGKGYVGGGINGYNNNPLNDFWQYDPATGAWDSIAHCPAKGVAFESTAFVVNGKAYVGTGGQQIGSGTTNYVPVADFWCYNPTTNTWDSVAPFGGGVRMGCFSYGACGKGYVGTGVTDAGQSQYTKDVWEFDPSNGPLGTWTRVADFAGTARYQERTFVIDNYGYVCGGDNNFVNTGSSSCGALWEYLPTDTPAFTASNTVCLNDTITFTDVSGYSPTNWYWQFPGATPNTSSAQNPKVTYSSTGQYTVILTAWNTCGDSGTKTFTNYINVTHGPSVSFTPDTPSVCNGQQITLTASGGSTYQWTSTTDTTDSIVVSPSTTTTYELSVANGTCVTDTFIAVSVTNVPRLIIQPQGPQSVCPGQSIALSVPVSGRDYNWLPSATLKPDTGDTVLAYPVVQTTYTVSGIDSLGCLATSDSEVVSVSNAPNKPTITVSGDVLTSSATQGNQWVRNDSILTGATGENYTATIPGWYQVIAENPANGCSTTSDSVDVTDSSAGVNRLSAISNQLSIYPNPTGGEIMLTINSSVGELRDWNLQITDVLGRTVYTQLSLNYSNAIDLSNLVSGVYFISVMNKAARAVVPVVKQ